MQWIRFMQSQVFMHIAILILHYQEFSVLYFVPLQIHNEGLNSSWIGYMTGQVKFHTNIINNKTAAIMKLRSQDDHSRHTIFTGGLYDNSVDIYFYCMHIHSMHTFILLNRNRA